MVPTSASIVPVALWNQIRQFTPARIGIEPVGVSQPTAANLDFQWDHAQARDAVNASLDAAGLTPELHGLGLETLRLHSKATDRDEYLQRPDLGRLLNDESQASFAGQTGSFDVVFVIADGLSATAVNRHAVPFLHSVLPALRDNGWRIAPAVLVEQSRVAVGDDVAEGLGAEMVVVLIGERPGLTSPDSLGVYLTWKPRQETRDSERNCISNVRPEGLAYADAASKLLYLMSESRRRCISGVLLKEEADTAAFMGTDSVLALN
ncbi:MAG: ethanolamine ammonia-lyase subunit EutC [Janthinobacterium lividum]